MTEAQFQQQIIDLGHLYGWRIAHFRPALTSKGYKTPVSADGKGFPDLVMVKRARLIFAEVKSDTGKLSPEQKDWITALTCSMRCECYIWKPENWDEIVEILTR